MAGFTWMPTTNNRQSPKKVESVKGWLARPRALSSMSPASNSFLTELSAPSRTPSPLSGTSAQRKSVHSTPTAVAVHTGPDAVLRSTLPPPISPEVVAEHLSRGSSPAPEFSAAQLSRATADRLAAASLPLPLTPASAFAVRTSPEASSAAADDDRPSQPSPLLVRTNTEDLASSLLLSWPSETADAHSLRRALFQQSDEHAFKKETHTASHTPVRGEEASSGVAALSAPERDDLEDAVSIALGPAHADVVAASARAPVATGDHVASQVADEQVDVSEQREVQSQAQPETQPAAQPVVRSGAQHEQRRSSEEEVPSLLGNTQMDTSTDVLSAKESLALELGLDLGELSLDSHLPGGCPADVVLLCSWFIASVCDCSALARWGRTCVLFPRLTGPAIPPRARSIGAWENPSDLQRSLAASLGLDLGSADEYSDGSPSRSDYSSSYVQGHTATSLLLPLGNHSYDQAKFDPGDEAFSLRVGSCAGAL
jgi:hypothetical protein